MDNSTNNMSEKLLQYIDGELQGVEKDELEKQLASDKDLRDELENLTLAKKAVRSYGLKQQVASIHTQMMKERQAPVRSINRNRRLVRYGLAIAASVVIVILANTLFNTGSPSANKLFADTYQPYELSTTRDGNTFETSIELAYKQKNYSGVIAMTDTSISIKNTFLSAMSQMELGNDRAAIARLKTVIAKNQQAGLNMLKDEAQYYLALAYLRNKNYADALAMMDTIKKDPVHTYYGKITNELIRNIENLTNRK